MRYGKAYSLVGRPPELPADFQWLQQVDKSRNVFELYEALELNCI
jgi:hypothetical protein